MVDRTSGAGQCPFCPYANPDLSVLSRHVDHHMALEDDTAAAAAPGEQTGPARAAQEERDRRFAEQLAGITVSQPDRLAPGLSAAAETVVPNVISLIQATYTAKRPVGLTKSFLASEMDHYSTSEWQHGWACGFNNLANLLSSLLRSKPIRVKLKAAGVTEVPTVLELQHRIEQAWAQGFDVASGRELGQQLQGQTKWIGANEVAALLRSLGIRCALYDFETTTRAGQNRFFDWVFSYFVRRNGSLSTVRGLGIKHVPPLFLQYPGHSMTIVGAEEYADKSRALLVMDVSADHLRQLRRKKIVPFRHTADSTLFSKERYQIVSIDKDPLYSTAEQHAAAKHIINQRPRTN